VDGLSGRWISVGGKYINDRQTDPSFDGDQIVTTGAAITTISTVPVSDNTVILITVWVSSRRQDSAGRGGYQRQALVYREGGGTATRQGNTQTLFTRETTGRYQVFINVSGNNALIQVRGQVGHTIRWKSKYFTTEVS